MAVEAIFYENLFCPGHCLSVYTYSNLHLYILHTVSKIRIISLTQTLKSGGRAGIHTNFFSDSLIQLASIGEFGALKTK